MKKEDIPPMKSLYFTFSKKTQWFNCVEWLEALEKLPLENLHRPNEAAAPWHWMAHVVVPAESDTDCQGVATIHMWPHLCKWQVDNEKAEVGWNFLAERIEMLQLPN